jgi:hypothetical protein
MVNVKISLLLLVAIATMACEEDDNKSSDQEAGRKKIAGVTTLALGTPINEQPFDPDCKAGDSDEKIDSYSFSYFKQDEIATGQSDEPLSNGAHGMNSSLIEGTYKDESLGIWAEILAENGMAKANFGIEFSYAKNYLGLCNPQDVPRGFVESSALTTIGLLSKAKQYYDSLASNVSLPKVKINLFPNYHFNIVIKVDEEAVSSDQSGTFDSITDESNNKELIYSITDNAAWSPPQEADVQEGTEAESAQFIIFPQSKEAATEGWFSGQKLWELPFVLSHEFGHHVFYMHYPKLFGSSYGLRNYGRQTGGMIFKRTNIPLMDRFLFARTATSSSTAVAINESFADLFAHYSLAEETDISQIKCMQRTRDVTSEELADGVKKSITDSVWDAFSAPAEEESDEPVEIPSPEQIDCASYSYSDPHIIGAILAHGVHRMFESANIAAGPSRTVALGQATLEWLVNQNAAIGSFETGDELFRVAIDEAFSVAANGLEDVAPMCQIVEEVFPYFYNTIAMDPDGSLARCFE